MTPVLVCSREDLALRLEGTMPHDCADSIDCLFRIGAEAAREEEAPVEDVEMYLVRAASLGIADILY